MLGVLVNFGAIILGSSIGLIFNKGISEKLKLVIMQGIGLTIFVLGIMDAVVTKEPLLLVISLVFGGIIGSLLMIQDRLDNFGKAVEKKFKGEEGFAKGFVISSLIYCVGAMAIVGSIKAGVLNDNTTLYIKSILDGVTAIIFTASFGIGVMFSSVPVLLYQGTIVLLALYIEPYLTDQMLNEISAVGGVLVLAIGINLLEIKNIRLGDLLPAVFIPAVYFLIMNLF